MFDDDDGFGDNTEDEEMHRRFMEYCDELDRENAEAEEKRKRLRMEEAEEYEEQLRKNKR